MTTDGGLKVSLTLPTDFTNVFQVKADELQFLGETAGTSHLDRFKTDIRTYRTSLWSNINRSLLETLRQAWRRTSTPRPAS